MRGIVFLMCTVVAGCASANSPPGSPAMETVRVSSGDGQMTTATHPMIAAGGGSVAFPIDRVWMVMRSVYDSLGITIGTQDPSNHVIGNPELKVRRRLAEVGLSQYIDCGNTQGTPSAETYEIRMSVLTQLQPGSPGTSVMTTLEARGRPMTMSGDFSLCRSTGVLEQRVVAIVKKRLGN